MTMISNKYHIVGSSSASTLSSLTSYSSQVLQELQTENQIHKTINIHELRLNHVYQHTKGTGYLPSYLAIESSAPSFFARERIHL